MGAKRKISAKENPKEIQRVPLINKSLYPLHLRRGAVSPASFSLKSASTASSLNALPRGYNELYNALNGKGPIILLSDQASMQSLCSINSRMTCSCSSLRTVGSDGKPGTPANTDGNRTRLGSDGSLVYSPTDKVDATQVTLSVPVECHGKRKENSESRHGTKGTEHCHSLPATRKGKCENGATENSDDRNETDSEPVEFVTIPNEGESENRDTLVNSEIEDGEIASHKLGRKDENITADNQNVNRSQHCQETMRENTANVNNSPSEFTIQLVNSPFEKGDDFKLPVKPVPVIGRAVSAYSIMEYNIGKNMLPRIDKSQAEYNNSKGFDCNSENGPKRRRHSAFTSCHDNTSVMIRRRGRLSTGCMKEHVTECEPLINGSVVQNHPRQELDGEKEEEDIFILQSDQNFQSGKRLRKIGTSDSPPIFIQEKHPPWNDSANTEGKHDDENLNEESGILPYSDSLDNDSVCSELPSIEIQLDNLPESVRTSRV